MTNASTTLKLFLSVLAACFLMNVNAFSQVEGRKPFPYVIKNNTIYPDNEVYVAIVGEDLSSVPGNHIWVDCKNGETKMMNRSYNTIKGPVYVWLGPNGSGPGYDEGMLARNNTEGNRGPFNDAMYANCFTKLSEIPNKTVMLPLIQGCRVFFSFKSQLYLCFRGSSPTPGMFSGYTAPAITDYTDPNQGIQWDMIELTYDKYGYFANTSRVDSYNIPMGMMSQGQDLQWDASGKIIVDAQGKAILTKSIKKAGEKKTHAQIVALWSEYTKAGSGKEEFANCLRQKTGAIIAPGKIKDFADGSIGTMPNPGPYVNYYKTYVDKVWSTYSNKDLVFDSGDAGIWTGRVTGETFTFTSNKVWGTGKGIITRKPTTQEVLEGKGCLDEDVQKINGQQLDRVIQAQICAALNRHIIPVDGETLPKPIPTIQKNGVTALDFSKSEYYYQAKPSNYYAAFWHQSGINMDDKAYGFCYDDVWNYASATPSFMPDTVTVYLDGWASMLTTDAVITPQNQTFTAPTTSAILDGSKCTFSPEREAFKTYIWSIVSKPAGSNPVIASTSSVITNISGLASGETIVKLKVSDGISKDSVTTSIKVLSACEVAPVISAGTNQTITITSGSTIGTTLAGTATDPLAGNPNRGAMMYNWTKISGNGGSIASPTALTTAISGLSTGSYEYELTTTIPSSTNCGSISSTSRVKVAVSQEIITKCEGTVSGTNGSGFKYEVSSDDNPIITFIPVANKSTAPVVIHYRKSGGSEGGYNNFSGMNFTMNGIKKGDTIEFYYVYTVPAGGEGNSSANWQSVTIGGCRSTPLITTAELSSQITLYPMPAHSTITVDIPAEHTFTSAQIINSMGSVVIPNINATDLSNIDISALPNGIYLIQLSGEKTIVKKFIKK